MQIEFKRTMDMAKVMNEIMFELLEEPSYRFFLDVDWGTVREDYKDFGWSEDAFLIEVEDTGTSSVASGKDIAGFIKWNLSRSDDKVQSVSILIKPQYVNKGIGVVALAKWLKYAMEDRRFRKIEFTCHVENKVAFRLYSQIEDIGGKKVGVKEKSSRLRDGRFYDEVFFEILRENYKPTEFFERIATGEWRK